MQFKNHQNQALLLNTHILVLTLFENKKIASLRLRTLVTPNQQGTQEQNIQMCAFLCICHISEF